MEPQKSIKEYTETELKAIAYDQIAISERAQKNVEAINNELLTRHLEKVDAEKVVTPYFDPFAPAEGDETVEEK